MPTNNTRTETEVGARPQDHLILQSRFQLKGYENRSAILGPEFRDPITTPSEFFSARYPDISKKFGIPFLETKYSVAGHADRVRPVSMNLDFFAAVLGGDKCLGHDVVYYEAEGQFYYREPVHGWYAPTTGEKLKMVLSQELLRCAEALQRNVDFEMLFVHFRADEHLQKVIAKAKVLNSCGDSFFFGPNARPRMVDGKLQNPNAEPPHLRFVEERIAFQEGAILLLRDLISCFEQYCSEKGLPAGHERKLRSDAYQIINKRFGLKLRKDLKNEEGKYANGWVNLAIKQT